MQSQKSEDKHFHTSDILKILGLQNQSSKYNENIENEMNENDLIQQLQIAKQEWQIANMHFNLAVDNDIVDYCTYDIKAKEKRLMYIIKQIKQIKMQKASGNI